MLAAGNHKCINAELFMLDVIKCITENNDESGDTYKIASPDAKQFSDECVDSRTTIKVQSEDNVEELDAGNCFIFFPQSLDVFWFHKL
jgi:hypothetical protein